MTLRGLIARLAAVTLLVGLCLFYFALLEHSVRYPVVTDFAKFLVSARMLVDGGDIYSEVPLDALGPIPPGATFTRATLHPNLNIPLLTGLFVPLSHVDYETAFVAWSLLSLVCGLVAFFLVANECDVARALPLRLLWLAFLFLAYFPTLVGVKLGQVSLLLFLLLAGGWVTARRGQEARAGILFGVAALVKPFALVVIPYLLACRRRWLAAWAAGTVAVGLGAGVALFGLRAHVRYLEVLGGISWYASNWNASLTGLFTRVLGGSENPALIHAPWLAWLLASGLSAAVFLVLLKLGRDETDRDASRAFDTGFALCLVVMLLVAPLGWMYYFPLLFIPFCLLIERLGNGEGGRLVRVTLVLAYVLSTVPTVLKPARELGGGGLLGIDSLYAYALVVLSVGLIAVIRAEREPVGERRSVSSGPPRPAR